MEENTRIRQVKFDDFSGEKNIQAKKYMSDEIERVGDLQLTVIALLGTREATLGEAESIKVGDILEMDRLAGHSVDIYVGNEKFAIAEIVVMEDNFGIVFSDFISKNGEFLKNIRKHGD